MSWTSVVNNSWLAQNLSRSYPFVHWASRKDSSGTFTIPDDLLVELYFPTGPEITIDPTAFHLLSLASFANGVSLQLGYAGSAAAVATVAKSGFSAFKPAVLTGVGAFSGSTGKIVVGSLDGLAAQPAGRFSFSAADAQLDCDCIRPQLPGVSEIRVHGGDGSVVSLQGVVALRSGSNFRMTNLSGGVVRMDAIQGEGLTNACECGGSSLADAVPITTINGVVGDGGSFTLTGDSCISVETVGSTIKLTDSCSSPCCGCDEQSRIESALDDLRRQIQTLEDFQLRLGSLVTQTTTVVIGSKVADGGCVSCS